MPIIILVVGAIAHRINCRNGGGGQWCHQGDQRADYWYSGWAVIVFAFIWSYLIFVWLAGYGHAVLSHFHTASETGMDGSRWKRYMCSRRENSGQYNMGLLTGATILFGNLSFLLGMVLSSSLGSGRENVVRRSSIIPFAFLLWALFCLIFSCWLLQFQPNFRDQDDDASSDYCRATDGSDRIGGKRSSNQKSSSRGRSQETTGRQSNGQDDGSKNKGFFSRFTGRSKSKERSKSNGQGSDDTPLV